MPDRNSVMVRVSWPVPDTWPPEVRQTVIERMVENLRNAAERVTPGVDIWTTHNDGLGDAGTMSETRIIGGVIKSERGTVTIVLRVQSEGDEMPPGSTVAITVLKKGDPQQSDGLEMPDG